MANAFHQISITACYISIVVDKIITITCIQTTLGNGHTNSGCEPVTERAGCGFYACVLLDLRVSGRNSTKLTEVFQLIQCHFLVAGQVIQGVEQHRAMTAGEHKTVAVRPFRVFCVEFQKFGIEHSRHVGHSHWHSGVAGIGFLHGIHRQGTDGVGHVAQIDIGLRGVFFSGCKRHIYSLSLLCGFLGEWTQCRRFGRASRLLVTISCKTSRRA